MSRLLVGVVGAAAAVAFLATTAELHHRREQREANAMLRRSNEARIRSDRGPGWERAHR